MNFNDVIKQSTGISFADKEGNNKEDLWASHGILPLGEKGNYSHQNCPKCSKKALLSDKNTGDFFCENCHWDGNVINNKFSQKFNKDNKNLTKPWWTNVDNPEALYEKISEKYNIDKKTLDRLGIVYHKHYFRNNNKIKGSLVIPSYSIDKSKINNYHFLPLDKDANILDYQDNLNNNIIGLNELNIESKSNSEDDDHIYITNSIIDYLTLQQANEESEMRVICIPPAIKEIDFENPESWSFLTSIEKQIFRFKNFTTLFSQTNANEKFKMEIARRLGLHLCSYINFQDYSELLPNKKPEDISIFDCFKEGYEEAVREILDKKTAYPIQGLHQLSEYEDEIDDIYENGLDPGYSWGYGQLDPYLRFQFKQWTLVTGIPGHGKSSFVESCLLNIAYLHNFKIAMYSPENTPLSRFYIAMMQKASGKSYTKDENYKGEKIGREEHEYWKKWINDRFFSILPEDNVSKSENFSIENGNTGSMTLGGILSLAAKAVFRHGVKIIVIDPWTEVEHQRPNGMTELEYLSKGLSMIKMFAKTYDVHVIMVAHPTKMLPLPDGSYPIPTPYNIAGGAHWRNKGDNIFTVYRNVGFPDEDITDIYIQKIRFSELGRVGSFSIRADKVTNFYFDDIDQEKRRHLLAKRMSVSFNKDKDAEAISTEDMLSKNMRLPINYNLRKLPKQFQTKKNIIAGNVVTTDYSYDEKPPF